MSFSRTLFYDSINHVFTAKRLYFQHRVCLSETQIGKSSEIYLQSRSLFIFQVIGRVCDVSMTMTMTMTITLTCDWENCHFDYHPKKKRFCSAADPNFDSDFDVSNSIKKLPKKKFSKMFISYFFLQFHQIQLTEIRIRMWSVLLSLYWRW